MKPVTITRRVINNRGGTQFLMLHPELEEAVRIIAEHLRSCTYNHVRYTKTSCCTWEQTGLPSGFFEDPKALQNLHEAEHEFLNVLEDCHITGCELLAGSRCGSFLQEVTYEVNYEL